MSLQHLACLRRVYFTEVRHWLRRLKAASRLRAEAASTRRQVQPLSRESQIVTDQTGREGNVELTVNSEATRSKGARIHVARVRRDSHVRMEVAAIEVVFEG